MRVWVCSPRAGSCGTTVLNNVGVGTLYNKNTRGYRKDKSAYAWFACLLFFIFGTVPRLQVSSTKLILSLSNFVGLGRLGLGRKHILSFHESKKELRCETCWQTRGAHETTNDMFDRNMNMNMTTDNIRYGGS